MARYKPIPTDAERVMRDDDFIVSKTDLAGKITYCNRIFIEFSGYHESDLLGTQHNIIRHPDMPRAVYKLLWDTVQDGREIFAYVKNLCNDGGFYWVLANVTPSRGPDGGIVGYYSVRRKPGADAIAHLTPLYQALCAEEARHKPRAGLVASSAMLNGILSEQGVSYEEFILGL